MPFLAVLLQRRPGRSWPSRRCRLALWSGWIPSRSVARSRYTHTHLHTPRAPHRTQTSTRTRTRTRAFARLRRWSPSRSRSCSHVVLAAALARRTPAVCPLTFPVTSTQRKYATKEMECRQVDRVDHLFGLGTTQRKYDPSEMIAYGWANGLERAEPERIYKEYVETASEEGMREAERVFRPTMLPSSSDTFCSALCISATHSRTRVCVFRSCTSS